MTVIRCAFILLVSPFIIGALTYDYDISDEHPLWYDVGHEDRHKWLAHYGMSDVVFDELTRIVVECKVLMLIHNENITATPEIVAHMANDTQLHGTEATMEQAIDCIEEYRYRQKRNVDKYTVTKWTMPVVYKYDGTQTVADIKMIEGAMNHWQEQTCVRFREADVSDVVEQQHLLFTTGGGCWSYTGMLSKSQAYPQEINLQTRGCTSWMGLPAHEIAHALGMLHQHLRPDRVNHVTVNENNIYSWYINNFNILDTGATFTDENPYDFGSVMHYAPNEMSIAHLICMRTVEPMYQNMIGQRKALSFHDAKLANKMYCDAECPTKLPCMNIGYTDPNDCSKCRCPSGLGGRLCETVEQTNGGCTPQSSSDIEITWEEERCIESRGYSEGEPYSNGDKCAWKIQAPKGCTIDMRFTGDFGTYCIHQSDTCFQWVEIRYDGNVAAPGPRFCCQDGKPKFNGKDTLTTLTNNMLVVFDAEYPLVTNEYTEIIPDSKKRGFRLCYKLTDPTCLAAAEEEKPEEDTCEPYPACACTSWRPWSDWGPCTQQCSGCGVQARERECLSHENAWEREKQGCNVVACASGTTELYRKHDMTQEWRNKQCCYDFETGEKLNPAIDCDLVGGK